jgi:hypothetical protein
VVLHLVVLGRLACGPLSEVQQFCPLLLLFWACCSGVLFLPVLVRGLGSAPFVLRLYLLGSCVASGLSSLV